MFDGTWTTLEILKAIEYGYKLNFIYEIWHYKEKSQYDSVRKIGGLFTEYVNMFLKHKEEASGFPDGVKNDQEKNAYIDDFYKQEGIKLEKNNIKYNAGIRSVMKLLLNSFWGRFGNYCNFNPKKKVIISKIVILI